MKIIIIGAGIAGLSSYLFLHKHLANDEHNEHTVKIIEAHDVRHMKYDASKGEANLTPASTHKPVSTTRIIGNAIGLGKNGLSVLGRIDDDGHVLRQIRSRGSAVSKWRMGTARGWRIVDANVQSKGATEHSGGKDKITNTVMIARQVAWEVLRDEVLRLDPEAVTKKKVEKIENLDCGKVLLSFSDGTSDSVDLLVGADGLRSVVRCAMFAGRSDVRAPTWLQWLMNRTPDKTDYTTPQYEGLTGLGGFVPGEVLKDTGYEQGTMSVTFGPNGFFGHGHVGTVATGSDDCGDNLTAWWSTFSSETPQPYQKEHDTAGHKETGIRTVFDRDRALSDLVERHKTWSDPSIQAILAYLKKSNSIEHIYPTYTTPELPTWTQSGNIVLVGDAAHALQPSSGQGACQALEDSEALALFLKHYLHAAGSSSTTSTLQETLPQRDAIHQALSKYDELRRPRVAKIYKQSQRMSKSKMDMGLVQEYIMYFVIWLMAKLGAWEKYNNELFEYDLPAEVRRTLEV